jgi:predicted ArsR family transcriptional regulator
LEETKVLIEAYLKKQFKKKKQVYPSDAADALGLRYETVGQVLDDLEREGKIQESR